MDLIKSLTNEHSKRLTEKIIIYIGDDKKRFKELMNLFFCNNPILSQRASWPVGYIGIYHPELVSPYFKKLIIHLNEPNLHDGIKRNTLRIFESIDIPTQHCAALFDQCLKFITSELFSTGIRAFAITTATNICQKFPELKNELKLILASLNEEPQKPAIKFRLKAALKKL